MSDGQDLSKNLEFEKAIEGKDDHELLRWLARMFYDHCEEERNRNHKSFGTIGIVGAFIGAAIAGAIDFFIKKG